MEQDACVFSPVHWQGQLDINLLIKPSKTFLWTIWFWANRDGAYTILSSVIALFSKQSFDNWIVFFYLLPCSAIFFHIHIYVCMSELYYNLSSTTTLTHVIGIYMYFFKSYQIKYIVKPTWAKQVQYTDMGSVNINIIQYIEINIKVIYLKEAGVTKGARTSTCIRWILYARK